MQLPVLQSQFLLNPAVTYLNFGSFGACPKPIFDNYQRWQRELEFEPVQFITVNGLNYLQQSRQALSAYIHCGADDIVFTTNPSYAINIIAKSFPLSPGDEILSTALEYGACDRTWNYYCKKAGARYVRQPITLPIVSREAFIEDFFKGLSPRTRAIFISHITSATALVLPVKEICDRAKQKGLITIVDGAHAPGHVPVDLSDLRADIYAGAPHKWMMTPKGCSFLYVNKELQPLFDPLLISWGYESTTPSHSRFLDYHQGQGTRDFSAFLTVPAAIAFLKEHQWETVAAACRGLVQQNAPRFCDLMEAEPISPISDEFLGQMFSIPIRTPQPEKLQRHLFDRYSIEVPVTTQDNRNFIRYSINAFNSQEDLNKLYTALQEITTDTALLESGQKVAR
jgi:isopenicillin-N epimerase